jgi:hypothetical protein
MLCCVVLQAFDLVTLKEVACKIHQLNPQWSEQKKSSYVKHTVREYKIHEKLHHPRWVGCRGGGGGGLQRARGRALLTNHSKTRASPQNSNLIHTSERERVCVRACASVYTAVWSVSSCGRECW